MNDELNSYSPLPQKTEKAVFFRKWLVTLNAIFDVWDECAELIDPEYFEPPMWM